jgi:hypothetical protein
MGSMNESAEAAETTAELVKTKLESDLEEIAASIWTVARQQQGKSIEILAILRLLERLHQEIRDSFFQDSLPDNRQALYALLRDIEQSGGWPYIHRMKLQAFLVHCLAESPEPVTEVSDPAPSDSGDAD